MHTPAISPLPQACRRREGLWIPAAARMTDGFVKATHEWGNSPFFIVQKGICTHLKILDFCGMPISPRYPTTASPYQHSRGAPSTRPRRASFCRLACCLQTRLCPTPTSGYVSQGPEREPAAEGRPLAAGWLCPRDIVARYRPRASAKRLRWKRGSPR